ncbi:MAG: hypothetical protein AABY15_01125 [Nanoarchaeota archaeon]
MKLKEIALYLSSILLIPLISAQFTVSEVFSYIDAQTIFLLVAFGVFGIVLKVILDRFPAFRGTTAGIMSLLLSLGMTYGINKWVGVNDLLPSIGISGDITVYLPIALLIIFLIALVVFRWKALIIAGLLLIVITLFTDLVYEKTIILTIGIVFMIIGLIWGLKSRVGNPALSNVVNGMPRLIIEARAYRRIADRQPNPKIYRNWAYFINYLKSRKYGRNEQEICQRMNVMPSDIIAVTKKYIN